MFDSIPEKVVIQFPESISIGQPYAYLFSWFVLILLVSFGLKLYKKGPHMKAGIASAISILIMYMACMLIYKYEPVGLQSYLAPLPFVKFEEDSIRLVLYQLRENGLLDIPYLCSQLVSMLVLAFLINQIYAFTPQKLKTPGWLVYRAFSTLFSIGVHYAVYKVLQKAISLIPEGSTWEFLLPFFPIAFLGFILGLFILALIKGPMKHFFTEINPTFVGLAGFFFSGKFGTNITRGIWATAFLAVFAAGLQYLGENLFHTAAITIGAFALSGGLMVLFGLVLLWILVGFRI